MASSFPGAIDSFTTKVDGVDDVLAAHVNDLQDSVVATQNFLSRASGWTPINPPPKYVSGTSVQFTGIDLSQLFPVGTKIKLKQTTDKYFYVLSTSYSGGNTTINLIGGSSYSVANAKISEFYFAHGLAFGFPERFNYVPVLTNITLGNGNIFGRFSINQKMINLHIDLIIGSTTSISSYQIYGLPISSSDYVFNSVCFALQDGIGWSQGMVTNHSSTQIRIETVGGGWWSGVHPFTFSENDRVVINYVYEML